MDILGNNNTDETFYVDSPLVKKLDNQGNLIEVINDKAISQAIKLWLVSSPYENIRNKTGGPLIKHLGKVMDDDRALAIKNDILNGLENNFSPSMTVVYLDVTPNVEKNYWIISLVAYNPDLNVGVNDRTVVLNKVY